MSIFGIQPPKFIGNIGTTNDEILLDHCVVLKDRPVPEIYSAVALRTGKRYQTNAGKHWLFQAKIHLFKYADPEATYLQLKSFEGTEVVLYRRRDGAPIYDTFGNDGKFILSSVVEEYYEDAQLKDYAILTFESLDFIGAPASFALYEEDFSGNDYNEGLFYFSNGIDVEIQNEQLEGAALHTLTMGLNGSFRTILQSTIDSDFEVVGEIWTNNTTNGTSALLLGIRNTNNYWAGICVNNVHAAGWPKNVVALVADGSYSSFAHVTDSGLSSLTRRFYKLTYRRSTNVLSFYYDDAGTWNLISTAEIEGFDSRKYYAGFFWGAYNANATTLHADNLSIKFSPETV